RSHARYLHRMSVEGARADAADDRRVLPRHGAERVPRGLRLLRAGAVIRALLVLVLAAGLAGAQEFPTSPTPTTFDCTTGCGRMRTRGVTCHSFARLAAGERGPRCRAYCQYEGMPFYDPGPGWAACASVAPRGL